MIRNTRLNQLLVAFGLWAPACATAIDGGDAPANERDRAFEILQQTAGAPVSMALNEAGVTRVVSMTHGFSIPGHATDPAQAAINFLTANHDVFQVSASEVGDFVITRVDPEPQLNMSHVTLQRMFNGIPVFQGALTIHMDSGNGVFTALGDDFYRIDPPTNTVMLSASEAAMAAGRALGVSLALTQDTSSEASAHGAVFSSPTTLDLVKVDQQIFQVADGDDRFSYQVLLSWLDDRKQQQYQLVLVDAQDGAMLASHNLVNTFTGKVFNVNAPPTATQSTDTRTEVSFDGNPAASPSGWVGTARKTVGNNAVAATDIDGNNTVGTNETQPVADANNTFDFPYSATQNAQNFSAAAVANAFFLVNDYHDRTYLLGFTETSGNFQTTNFGKGGAQDDPVNVDAQDGAGTNNANFSTPPDGSRPRMQMFIFNTKNGADGVTQDGDFDPSVIYHENTHGVSNRLVGGGSTACLGDLQSGGMGEGWGDLMGSSFLNNPIVGAYVTGNATTGIRHQSMANSTFTYNDVKNGSLAEVHDVGELWAAVLWDVRKSTTAATTEQLVISGMKLTPCNPTMLNARDAIIQADANINAGANRCRIWTAFARRQMGTGASSPNPSSTTQIVTSTAVPADCVGTGTTNAAIAFGSTGAVIALHGANTDFLWTVGPDGVGHQSNPALVLAPGTSPAIAVGPSGPVIALHGANTDFLWTVGPDGVGHQSNPALVLASGTSPAIAVGPSGPVIALHGANTDFLWTVGPDGVGHQSNPPLVLAPGTSPAIAVGPSGPVIALHGANTDFLWTVGPDGVGHQSNPALVLAPGTSPAIAVGPSGAVIAVHGANTDFLWTVGPDGVGHQSNPALVLAPGTSPAIAVGPSGAVIAVHGANTDFLWTVGPDGVGHQSNPALVLAPGTSPAIAMGPSGPVIALHGANTDFLWTVGPDGVGHQSNPPLVLASGINP